MLFPCDLNVDVKMSRRVIRANGDIEDLVDQTGARVIKVSFFQKFGFMVVRFLRGLTNGSN